jgi:cobalt-zinc-cadmium resistance protein CzcA
MTKTPGSESGPLRSFLSSWIEFQRRQKVLFLSILAVMVAYGGFVAWHSEIEAFPELTNVQVQVITLLPGKAAEEVERQVTVPLEVATTGTPGLINQRSLSMFGLSVITLTFADDVSIKQARLDLSQKLNDADLPDGVKPSLSPESTPTGEVFRYTLVGSLPVDEMRLIDDWTLEREFKSIPGVADVNSFGGPTRTIEVRLNIKKMNALGLTVGGVAQALNQNHANAGGSVITQGGEACIVRSIGLYETPQSLESAVLGTKANNAPIRVRDIGKVQFSHHLRLGQVGQNERDDVVVGIILLRVGANTLETCRAIRDKIAEINLHLPPGAKVVPYYDRTDLIGRCSETVFHNILFGILLVCLILTLGMGLAYWPLVLAVAVTIPFALLSAFVGMKLFGYAPNLVSLGAVDFGIIVETAIFAADAAIFSLGQEGAKKRGSLVEELANVLAPALLCAFLLVIAFVPILSLQRVEGRLFRPLGITLISALVGGQLGALIFVPFFSLLAPRGRQAPGMLRVSVDRILAWCEAMSQRLATLPLFGLGCGLAFAALLVVLTLNLGREFLPDLNEGSLWIRAKAPQTISREASVALAGRVRAKLHQIPEAVNVFSQLGRPDDGTDVNGFDTIEFFVDLGDPHSWKSAHDFDGFVKEAEGLLKDVDGADFSYSQYIKDNVDEAISGVKGELVVKVFGPNLEELQKYAGQIEETLKHVDGANDVEAEELLGQPELRFTMDHGLLARYGLNISDAEDLLESALLGKVATTMTDDQGRTLEVVVKPDIPEPPTKEALAALPLLTSNGVQVSVGKISSPALVKGVSRVYRESGQRRVAVTMSVRGRAMVDLVEDASRQIAKTVNLPPQYSLQWSGSFENAQRAARQLMTIVPLCVLAMLIILYTWFGNWSSAGYLLWEVPFSAAGGLAALSLAGLNLSISAAAGGIVLIGVSFLTGMMLISEWIRQGSVSGALKHAGHGIVLSSGVAIVGLIPAAFSHGMGSETARPFAVMIIGGLSSSLLFTLTILPALLHRAEKNRDARAGTPRS